MKFYQRLEWQLAITIVVMLGITITFTGVLQQGSVNIFISPVEPGQGAGQPQFSRFFADLPAPKTTDIKAQAQQLVQAFDQLPGAEEQVIVVTDRSFKILDFNHADYLFIELVRREPDDSSYSVVLSSNYNNQDLFQIYRGVPGVDWGEDYLIYVVPDPTNKEQPEPMALFTSSLNSHFHELGIYYLLVAIFVIALVRFRLSPLRRLESFSKKLSSETLPPPMPASNFQDEIGNLISAFNQARDRLETEKNRRAELLADMAHELRTPLHNVKGRLELAAEGIIDSDQKTIAYAHNQIQKLVQLVNDIDLIGAIDDAGFRLDKSTINLTQFINDKLQANSLGQPFQWTLQGAELNCQIDPMRMTQVLDNLVQNALTAKPEGLQLTIECSAIDSRVQIIFKDNGPGVPAEALPKLFDRLYRVDASRNQNTGGSGLGLSIVRKIIQLHGGTISAFLPEEGGLGYKISLPLA